MIICMPISMDFSVHSFRDAVIMMRCDPKNTVIYVTRRWMFDALEVAEKYGCQFVVVPDEIVKGLDYWAVECGPQLIWSQGA
jgi:hypothetical protein